MNKLLIFILAVGMSAATAMARDHISRQLTDLPQAAQNIISGNFKAGLSHIKIDKTMGHVDDYEVILNDGTEIEFDNKGNWKKIETAPDKSVPSKLLPAAMTEYVKANYKGAIIVGVERERNKFEVELSNGIDMEFDISGKFLRFD